MAVIYLTLVTASKGDPLRLGRNLLIVSCGLLAALSLTQMTRACAQASPDMPPAPLAKQVHMKHVLVIGQTKGFEHDSIPDAMAAVYNMGKESGLWDTVIRTDTE